MTRTADAALDALGDHTRRSIVRLLAARPLSVGDVAAGLPVSRPAVSQHLRVLQSAGLVAVSRQGTRRIYRLEGAGAAAARDFLDQMWDVALARFALLADNTSDPGRVDRPRTPNREDRP